MGHSAVVHGATVGNSCVVGMSATILNGAVVGQESLVAAGALFQEGQKTPPRSLVAGVPGKSRRTLTEEEAEKVRQNAQAYLRLKDLHRQAAQSAEAEEGCQR